MKDKTRHNRVYLLGAGFSTAAGVPVLNDILPAMLEFGKRPDYIEAQKEHNDREGIPPNAGIYLESMIDKYNKFLGIEETSMSLPNLEDLMSFLDENEELQLMTSHIDILWAVEDGFHPLNDLLAEFLWSFTKGDQGNDVIESFCKGLTSDDIILTLNWDNLVERHMFLLGKSFETLIDL